jgi:hypothetical protein
LTTAITCSPSWPPGTQSATVTIAPGDFIKFIFNADGSTNAAQFAVSFQ